MNKRQKFRDPSLFVGILLLLCVSTSEAKKVPPNTSVPVQVPVSSSQRGETRTLLPDGRILIVGGQDNAGKIKADASIQDPQTGASTPTAATLNFARAWHTATVLPDGKVLILGGIGSDGAVVDQSELFNPASETFQTLTSGVPAPRAFHSATLLTDGHLWIAGGIPATAESLRGAELWDPRQKTSSSSVELAGARRNHSSCLLPDGRVLLWGGKDDQSAVLTNGEIFDPKSQTTTVVDNPQALLTINTAIAELRASSPEDGATDVALDALISMRFSRPLQIQSIDGQTVVLQGPEGVVDSTIIGAEGGMLAFITPKAPLVPGTSYTLTFSGGADANRNTVAFTQFTFTTAGEIPVDDRWIPTADWMTHRPDSKWQSLPPLQAGPGVTALAGQVLKLDGNPLPHATLIIDGQQALTDGTGRFLLKNITAGHHAMKINATTANTGTRAYGIYEVGVDIQAGQTNVLSYIIWMTPLDTAHTVTIPSPTLAETVITTPLLPGLELHLPANTVITGDDGRVVTRINITPIPLDRPPFPLPKVPVPIYFTIQPGSSYINVNSSSGPKGAQLFYPNGFHYPPGTQFNFWNYDPDNKGWFVYGQGRVSANASQVIPNPGVVLYEFTGAMVSNPSNAPPDGPPEGDPDDDGGEPVSMSTGLFVYNQTDLTLPDVIPISVTRTYRPRDSVSRAFGIGTNHPYDMFMIGTNNTTPGGGYLWQDLILPDGGRIHFPRISPCTGANGFCDFGDAVYENTSSPTDFYGATIKWGGCSIGAWMLTKKDGTVYCFPDSDGSSVSQAAAPVAMHDRYGNALTFVRVGSNLTQITSPNGRWIKFTYDTSNRIIQAQDNINRIVKYSYDAGGRLTQVTDANGGISNYTYDAFNEMLTIQDARGIVYLTNQYDSSGRVVKQTQADNSVFQFAYTNDPITGRITQTDLTDSLGNIQRTTFNANGYTSSVTRALGKPQQQTITYVRDPNTNLVSSAIDALGRETHYTYDALGNMISVTAMAKTAAAATTQFTYDPNFNQLASVTDSLNHTTSYQRDLSTGNLTAIADPLGHQMGFAYYPNGQLMSTTDPLANTTQYGHDGADLISITDPLTNSTTMFTDGAGRLVAKTDAQGNRTSYGYDNLSRVLKVTDAKGGATTNAYDLGGNLLSSTDPLNRTTTWTYDNVNRIITRTDPLLRQESFSYDLNGNMISSTDRKGQVTAFAYDSLNRLVFVGFNTVKNGGNTTYESTVSYTYDAANRMTQAVDSAGGTITKTYDDVNRLITETTPQGSVTYAYDSVGRQATMTVAGQPAVNYTYDNANRLTQITQATSSVGFSYDNANRRSALTLPNGVVVSYSYDNDSHLTSLTYQMGANTLGNLTYSYDSVGRRTQIGGSFARTGLPAAVTSAAYDAANELTNWNSAAISYDNNGNMLSDGTNTFSWNARNQVTTLNGSSPQYDALGRRIKNVAGKSFLFDGSNAAQELSGTTVTANILTGRVDELFQRTDSNGTTVPLADALGNVLALSDVSGNIQTSYTYDPFGNTTVSGRSSANPSQYTGRENEGSGLYYYRARYYNSLQGRFISEDPARVGGDFYAYAADSPANLADPSGLGPIDWLKNHLTVPPPPPANFPAPKAPCICPGLDNFLDHMRQHYPTHKPNHQCATAVKTGLAAAGFPYWRCDALDCGQGLVDRGFTPLPDTGGIPLQPGDIVVQQPVIGPDGQYETNPAGHIAVWDGTHWISDFTQNQEQVYKVPVTDFTYYRYPCSCSN